MNADIGVYVPQSGRSSHRFMSCNAVSRYKDGDEACLSVCRDVCLTR